MRAIKQDKMQEKKYKRKQNNLKNMEKEINGIPKEMKEECDRG